MSDDDKTPPYKPPKRLQTSEERDLRSRKERSSMPAVMVSGEFSTPSFVDPESEPTGVHVRVKALSASYRSLDAKVDKLGDHVADLRETTGRMEGQLDILVDNVSKVTTVHTEHMVQDMRVEGMRRSTAVELEADHKKTRNALIVKAVALVIAVVGAVESLHVIGGC